jgi:hypothetical protein
MRLARLRRLKAAHFFLYVNYKLIQMQQYYEKQVMLRGGHARGGEGKRRKLRT